MKYILDQGIQRYRCNPERDRNALFLTNFNSIDNLGYKQIRDNLIPMLRKSEHFDFFIYGHRHLPLVLDLKKDASTSLSTTDAKYVNLGDWISYFTYGVFDGENFELKEYK